MALLLANMLLAVTENVPLFTDYLSLDDSAPECNNGIGLNNRMYQKVLIKFAYF